MTAITEINLSVDPLDISRDDDTSSHPSSTSSSLAASPLRKVKYPTPTLQPIPDIVRPNDVSVRIESNDLMSYFTALSEAALSRRNPFFNDQNVYMPNGNKSTDISFYDSPEEPRLNVSIEELELELPHNRDMNRRARIILPNGTSHIGVICPFDERVHYAPDVKLENLTAKALAESNLVFSKEYAELSTVCRVLSMAMDPLLPLLDRFKFLCVVSNMVDEHFSKKLGYIPKLDLTDLETSSIILKHHIRPRTKYEDDLNIALKTIIDRQHQCLTKDVLPQMMAKGVEILTPNELTPEEEKRVNSYYNKHIRPALSPTRIGPTHPFPLIQSHDIHIYATLFNPRDGNSNKIIIRVPSQKRLIPVDDSERRFITSESLCLINMDKICYSMIVTSAQVFRVVRNTRISIEEEDDIDDMMEYILEEIHRRRQAPVNRLEVLSSAPQSMIEHLTGELNLDKSDVYVIQSPLMDLSSAMSLAFVPLPWLQAVIPEPAVPGPFKGLQDRLIVQPGAIFGVLRQKDVLVEYPKHDFENSAVLFLHAAARDPRVRTIKTVLYRCGGSSPVVAALIRAAKNGKEVSVVVELKASFDESQNADYAKTLRQAGCNVSYGVMDLKVHSKLMLVVREEESGMSSYANLATGNFHPKTAKLYTDFALFTSDKDICSDVHDVFHSLTGFSWKDDYRTLLVAPFTMKNKFISLIQDEAENARKGKPARIACQMNGLSDTDIVHELYQASQAGVRIDLIIRSACRLRPGVKGISDNIRVYSWLGEVLQHRRLFYFHANGDPKYFIGSADWRTRNLIGRVEVVVPIKDPQIQKRLAKAFKLIDDTRCMWRMAPDGRYYKGLPETASPSVSVVIGSGPRKLPCPVKSRTSDERSSSSEGDHRFTEDGSKISKDDYLNNFALSESHEGVEQIPNGTSPGNMGNKSDTLPHAQFDATGMQRRTKSRRKYPINIKGNKRVVDKIAVGAIPIRILSENHINSVEVLMVSRGGNDPWAFPKGGQNEGETEQQATVRIAREKAGVSKCEILGNLGWIEVTKRHKQMALQTFVLLVEETGQPARQENPREVKWISLDDATREVREQSLHEFTEKAMDRAVEFLKNRFNKTEETESSKPEERVTGPIALTPITESIDTTSEPSTPLRQASDHVSEQENDQQENDVSL